VRADEAAEGVQVTLTHTVKTLCCGQELQTGTVLELHKQHSPKRWFVRVLPERSFVYCGHSFWPVGGMEGWKKAKAEGPQSGPLGDLDKLAKAWPIHKVKVSNLW